MLVRLRMKKPTSEKGTHGGYGTKTQPQVMVGWRFNRPYLAPKHTVRVVACTVSAWHGLTGGFLYSSTSRSRMQNWDTMTDKQNQGRKVYIKQLGHRWSGQTMELCIISKLLHLERSQTKQSSPFPTVPGTGNYVTDAYVNIWQRILTFCFELGSHCVVWAGLDLMMILPPRCWDYRLVPSCLAQILTFGRNVYKRNNILWIHLKTIASSVVFSSTPWRQSP